LELLPLFLREQRSANLPADVVTVIARSGDPETMFQQGLLDVWVKHGVWRFNGIDIGGSEESGDRVSEKIVLNPGFAIWICDVIMADARAAGLTGFGCRINGQNADIPTLVLEDIE